MQTWKQKKRLRQTHKPNQPWKSKLATVFLFFLTLAAFAYAFPSYTNQITGFVHAKTGLTLPSMNEKAYRLGLDLQGGTHLVYEADMKDIPETDRAEALSGVRDVIERRVNAFGVSEPLVQTSDTAGAYRVIVELAGVLDVTEAIQQIGETPVLEFKEQGDELDREPTAEDQKALKIKQAEDRVAAQAILKRALAREDFEKLVAEASTESTKDQTKGLIERVTSVSVREPEIAKAISQNRVNAGHVYWKTIEKADAIEIVKVLETTTAKNMRLSHILVCFEGKTGCQKETTQMDASVQMNDLKSKVTPENFAELAKQFSTDPSVSTNSGDLGFATAETYVPSFAIVAESLEVGKISDVVETDFGYHLMYKQAERTVPAYKIQHIRMKLSTIYDIVPPSSPWKNTQLSGKQLERANVQFDQQTGNPFVGISFNAEGGELFGKLTEANVGKPIAIFLDGSPISTPVVQNPIYGGQAIITGDFTLEEAKVLAQRLNAGALPVPVNLLSQQTIGPTLGASSLQMSIKAALIGFALVAMYMIAYYRLAGLYSVVALILYAFLNLVVYRIFDVTITLSGIAGFILSLGMAVDANVLIIERMKEEVAGGRDLKGAIHEGFIRAWPAIRDGNVSTLMVALVLYIFSASFIRGFALMLGIGVFMSLFTAITATRIYMKAVFPKRVMSWPIISGLPQSKKV